jgi:hypothetical protein
MALRLGISNCCRLAQRQVLRTPPRVSVVRVAGCASAPPSNPGKNYTLVNLTFYKLTGSLFTRIKQNKTIIKQCSKRRVGFVVALQNIRQYS